MEGIGKGREWNMCECVGGGSMMCVCRATHQAVLAVSSRVGVTPI